MATCSKMTSRGVKLIYLPTYSPNYNPIEEMFLFVKAYIRRHGEQFHAVVEFGDKVSPYIFLCEALSDITTNHTVKLGDCLCKLLAQIDPFLSTTPPPVIAIGHQPEN